jgi:hypothetical protein
MLVTPSADSPAATIAHCAVGRQRGFLIVSFAFTASRPNSRSVTHADGKSSGWSTCRHYSRSMTTREPRDIVQAAIDAYHDHDLDRCLSFCAPDVVVTDADGAVIMSGSEEVRARYAASMAKHPNMHYDIPNRIALGSFVVDEELVTGFSAGGPEMLRAVLVYRFVDDQITAIQILS